LKLRISVPLVFCFPCLFNKASAKSFPKGVGVGVGVAGSLNAAGSCYLTNTSTHACAWEMENGHSTWFITWQQVKRVKCTKKTK